ncbi:hypothetical protein P3875_01145 [Myroides sp. JBRI-B21084]|uniref:hypothetical protein n=1 Tax=Myroides sp. JBRI-B21084 TaxID=3119977 RepID=UPI0026E22D5C|nr:hypothetical protein [Paenimyroides cloacae]WKW46707.1 hypothetical protein P3875_01145 [Paenimyroides cloacae]
MKTFFEYLYYRIAKLNFLKNYERATITVTVCQTLIIVNIIFFTIYGPFKIIGKANLIEYLIFLSIFFGLDYYNNKLYRGRFDEFDKKWGNESKKDKIIGMVKVISFIIFCWGLLFINGWIYSRYK